MSEAPARLVQVTVGGSREPWQSLGVEFDDRGGCRIGQVSLRVDESRTSGFLCWAFDPPVESIDGIETGALESPSRLVSENFSTVDHVVVMTDSLERTSRDIATRTGSQVRRVREAGDGVMQAFHRSGEVILEVVQTPTMTGVSLWGFVLVANDLPGLVDRLGSEVVGDLRDAHQPGRLIATVRHAVGLGVNVALMTPNQRP